MSEWPTDPVALANAFRDFVRAHVPPGLVGTAGGPFEGYWGGRLRAGATPDRLAWLGIMAEHGLTAPTFAPEHGGAGLSAAQAQVLRDVLGELQVPPPLVGFGLAMLAPVLQQFGTEAQKRTYLTAIARGDLRWCQGYSEPGAGSDLASLACRAERDGDTFVLNGSKIWTSHADLSDWMFCLVRTRTGPRKQEGITFILIDLRSPGVQIRPILLISGASPFCEVFFEDVRVPAEQVVHEVDAGWTVAKSLLQHERTAIGVAIGGQLSQAEGELVSLARRALDTPEGPLPGAVAQDLARFGMEAACFDLTRTRLLGGPAGPESSTLKLAGTELKQRRLQLAMQLAGPDALGWSPEGFEPDTVQVAREWLRSRGNSIEGGTSEIQLNIIARRVLGLPEGA